MVMITLVRLIRSGLLALAVIGAFAIASCEGQQRNRTVFEYCSGPPVERLFQEPMRFIFVASRLTNRDVSGPLEVVETGDARGIIEPMPISLPNPKSARAGARDWRMRGYEFRSTSPDVNGQTTIYARPEQGVGTKTEVLYSPSLGVTRIVIDWADGRTPAVWEVCRGRGFTFDDLKVRDPSPPPHAREP
jgi:hypothetical protein